MESMFNQPIQPHIPETSGGMAGTIVTLTLLAGTGWLLYDKYMNDDWVWNRFFKRPISSADGIDWLG